MNRAFEAPLTDVKKIAVLRRSAIGDFVFALPALHALKSAYPQAQITYIGRRWHAAFLADRPGPVGRVAVLPCCPGISAPAQEAPGPELPPFIDAMRAAGFDLALQMYGGGSYANPLVRRLGARFCIGMKAADAEPLDRWVAYAPLQNRRLQLLEVAALAGAGQVPLRQELAVTAHDRRQAAAALAATDQPLVLIHPGASDPRRRWAAARFASVADALAQAGARIAVSGTAAEMPLVQAVLDAMRRPAVALGALPLGALCGVLERAALLVSNDTGPLHLALAVGTPAVGIYWLSNLIEAGPLRQHIHRAALATRIHCPVCGMENLSTRCAHDASFVDDVAIDTVTALALELFDGRRRCSASPS
jgi:ADP-heptose:LPS heptosyltransferase